jgi:ribonuclease D
MTDSDSINIEYVDSQKLLEKLAKKVKSVDVVYFDMEVDNMYHYHTQICLLQLLIGSTCYLVDPLSGITIKNLLAQLKKKLLVIHGSDFDLRMLYQMYQFTPDRIFDTMIAAQLTGKTEFSLAALVKHYFNITMNKKFQRADWSKRPLSSSMIYYAAQDTIYLPDLKDYLTRELADRKRLGWLEEWCRNLIISAQSEKKSDPDLVWRIKGSSKLEPRQLCVLKAAWKWRDKTAKSKNKAPYKILNSRSLLHFTSLIPPHIEMPVNPEKLPIKTNRAFKHSLLKTLRKALATDPSKWPAKLITRKPKSPAPKPAVVEKIKEVRNRIAMELGITESVLASKDAMSSIAATGIREKESMHKLGKLMQWQEDVLFDPWLKAVNKNRQKAAYTKK